MLRLLRRSVLDPSLQNASRRPRDLRRRALTATSLAAADPSRGGPSRPFSASTRCCFCVVPEKGDGGTIRRQPSSVGCLNGGRPVAGRLSAQMPAFSSRRFHSSAAVEDVARAPSSVASLPDDHDDDDDDDDEEEVDAHRCDHHAHCHGGEEEEAPPSGASKSRPSSRDAAERRRLMRRRVVGIFAHVDAGKTTCTERMLALAGLVRRAGSVDDGDTVTDYLDAERERGITIQSAAVSIPWKVPGRHGEDPVTVTLIDTPGHVDFSVEVHRSVAVLDGAVLVVDAVAGAQAQTETVWRSLRQRNGGLPAIAVVNKMDKDGRHFGNAVQSIRDKLPQSNPVPIQLPLFRTTNVAAGTPARGQLPPDVVADSADVDSPDGMGDFAGVADLVHLRAVLWPDLTRTNGFVSRVEDCVPTVVSLVPNSDGTGASSSPCPVLRRALQARRDLVEALANVDEAMAECYLEERDPTPDELRRSLRAATLANHVLPVLAAAAARGKGVEPILDAVADYLPSPLDRPAPAILDRCGRPSAAAPPAQDGDGEDGPSPLGHALHPSLLALAFKVVHLKGRGGSGDGRVVFARVYSGQIRERQVLHASSPPAPGESLSPDPPRTERVGGLLELTGGRFGKLPDGACGSGDVCALVGLKTVVTGDTLTAVPAPAGHKHHHDVKHSKHRHQRPTSNLTVCLAGVSAPKPVLTVRLEAESAQQQARLSDALELLAVEDPSLVVQETESTTLLSGLGELHIEVTLDRLQREFGLEVRVGAPAVAYRETLTDSIASGGLIEYQRTVGGTCLQGSVELRFEPTHGTTTDAAGPEDRGDSPESSCSLPTDPVVTLSPEVRAYLGVDPHASEKDLERICPVSKALIGGCRGALKRGPVSQYPLANVVCHVVNVDSEGGLHAWQALPGALRAAASNAVTAVLASHRGAGRVLEPVMGIEVSLPNVLVGSVLSDLTGRRGTVHEVIVGGDGGAGTAPSHAKAQIRGEVPLVEILGYANGLRSLTGGEGSFTAEYKGHAPSTSTDFR